MNRVLKQKNDSNCNIYNFPLLVPYPCKFLVVCICILIFHGIYFPYPQIERFSKGDGYFILARPCKHKRPHCSVVSISKTFLRLPTEHEKNQCAQSYSVPVFLGFPLRKIPSTSSLLKQSYFFVRG